MVIGAIVVLFLLVAGLLESHRRSRARMARLERTQTIDLATTLGTPFALERELSHAIGLPQPLSCSEVQIAEIGRAKEAALTLRSVCAHGIDQLFCLDLPRGSFLLIIYGKLDPARVANYFLGELGAVAIGAKIGWAYTCSADPAVRKRVREAAHAAMTAVAGPSGVEVALVEPHQWPADDPTEEVLLDLSLRRVALCLSRKELARAIGISVAELRDLETGRARSTQLTGHIRTVVDTIEESIVRVKSLEATAAAAGLTKPEAARDAAPEPTEVIAPPTPPDGQSQTGTATEPTAGGAAAGREATVQNVIALQRTLLSERAARQPTESTASPRPPSPSNGHLSIVPPAPSQRHGGLKIVAEGDADEEKK